MNENPLSTVDVHAKPKYSPEFLDIITKQQAIIDAIRNSPEYASFVAQLQELVPQLPKLTFVFDLEGTTFSDRQNPENYSEKKYFINPWTIALISSLVAQGQEIVFWTNAATNLIPDITQDLPDDLQSLPLINREKFTTILNALIEYSAGLIPEAEAFAMVQRQYAAADLGAFKALAQQKGDFFTSLPNASSTIPTQIKLPNSILSPGSFILIDDNADKLQIAQAFGMLKTDAISCMINPTGDDFISIIKDIIAEKSTDA